MLPLLLLLNLASVTLLILGFSSTWAQDFKFFKQGNLISDLDFAHLHVFLNYTTLLSQHNNTINLLEKFMTFKPHFLRNKRALNTAVASLVAETVMTTELVRLYAPFFPTTTTREKRGPAGWIALGVSTFNSFEILQLKLQVQAQDRVNDAILQSIKEEDLSIHLNAESIQTLKNVTLKLTNTFSELQEHAALSEFHLKAYEYLRRHHTVVETWGRALSDALHGRFCLGLVTSDKLEKGMTDLKRRVERKEFRMLSPGLDQVYTSEVSHSRESDGIHIFVHLPVTRGDTMTIYHHINLPFNIGDMQALVNTEEKYIAMDDDRTRGMTFTNNDFTRCTQVGDNYICPETRVLNRDIGQTCMGALLSSDTIKIKARCKLRINPYPKQAAVRVAKNTFFIHSPNPDKVTVTCKDKASSYDLIGTQEIKVQPDCTHTTLQLSIKGQSDTLNVGDMTTTVTIGTAHPEAFEDWEDPHTEKEFATAIQSLRELKEPAPVSMDALRASIIEKQRISERFCLLVTLTCIVAVALIAGLGAAIYLYRQRNNRHQKQSFVLQRLLADQDGPQFENKATQT